MGKRACHRGLSARWPFCFDDRRCEKSRDCAETVGTAGDRSSGKGNASGQAARRGTAGGHIKPSAGDCGVPCCPDRHWCRRRQFFAGLRRVSLPDFRRTSPPKLDHVAALPLPNPAPVPVPAPVLVPDPVVRAGLRDIQSSQQQNADTLASLTQTVATQQADLKRITRQLTLLTAQVNSLQNPAAAQPLTTSSIGGPLTTSSIPRPTPRTRVIHASRRAPPPVLPPATVPASLPALPKPAGPVSVGGAPLSPAPGSGPGTS